MERFATPSTNVNIPENLRTTVFNRTRFTFTVASLYPFVHILNANYAQMLYMVVRLFLLTVGVFSFA